MNLAFSKSYKKMPLKYIFEPVVHNMEVLAPLFSQTENKKLHGVKIK